MEDKDPHPLIAATLMAFLCFGIVTFFIMLFVSCDTCTTNKRESIEVSILLDVTETQLAQPDANEIVPLLGLDTSKWSGAVFRFAYLTDVSLNGQTAIALADGGNRLLASSFTRDKEVTAFTDSIRAFLASLSDDTVGRPHSSIYLPLAAELTRLTQSHATTKVLLVYSDLMENNTLSFYDKRTLQMLQSKPEEIQAQLETKAPLSDLTGIEVHLIFQPVDADQDQTFQIVSGFYKTLLESHGATVTISANVVVPIAQK